MAHQRPKVAKKSRSFWRELPFLVVVAVVLALLIKTFAVQAFRIPSGSMEQTLDIGDRVLVNKVIYHVRDINRGDIVVFNGRGSWDGPAPSPSGNAISGLYHGIMRAVGLETDGTDYIKRVIGLPGDRVACCDSDGRVTVNRVPLTENSYLFPGNAPSGSPFNVVVPQGRIWVMGDHRDDSADSRLHQSAPGDGTVPVSAVVGRAFVVVWPLSRMNTLPIPSTFRQAALASGSAAAPAVPLALGMTGALPLMLVRRTMRRRERQRAGE